MTEQLNKDLNEIADFIGERLNTLMPSLQKELEGTPAWPVLRILGSYLHFRMDAQQEIGTEPEHYTAIHNHSLAKTLALPMTQDFIQNQMTQMFNGMAGVGGQPQPTYDVSKFQEDKA